MKIQKRKLHFCLEYVCEISNYMVLATVVTNLFLCEFIRGHGVGLLTLKRNLFIYLLITFNLMN